jgi:hypothetical protein
VVEKWKENRNLASSPQLEEEEEESLPAIKGGTTGKERRRKIQVLEGLWEVLVPGNHPD